MPRVKKLPPARLQDRPGKWKILLRRQRRLWRPILAIALLVGVFGGGALAVHAIGQGPSFRERLGSVSARLGLRVQNVIVEGRVKTPEPLLRAALGVSIGDPTLGVSVAGARARIETLAWVQSATVERRLPGTIVVQLQERRPFAVWQNQGKFVLIDRNGEVVTDSDVASFAGQVPLVVGAGAPAAAAGLIDALAAHPQLAARMVAAVRVGERRWNLHLANRTDVLLPEGAEAVALARLAELHNAHALLDRPLAAVDLRLPDRLVVRPQGEKEKAPDKADPRKRPT